MVFRLLQGEAFPLFKGFRIGSRISKWTPQTIWNVAEYTYLKSVSVRPFLGYFSAVGIDLALLVRKQ